MKIAIRAARVLRNGGIVAYPTEGVFGLGCLPDDQYALRDLLVLKQRHADKGVILLAATLEQLHDWIALPNGVTLPPADAACAITWIVPPAPRVSALVLGNHKEIAVRLTSNPVARELCNKVRSPIVSTSANVSGRPVARNRWVLQRMFGNQVDYVVPGDCGPNRGPSEIRHLRSGAVLRPRTT